MQRSMARSNVNLVPLSADDKPLLLRKLQGSIHFEKTLTATTAPGDDNKYSKLTLPAHFVRKHGDKFDKSVILRTESSTKPWPVNLSIWHHSPTSTQVRFAAGWQAFAISNGLLEGDLLIFVLTAMSEFKVYVFRRIEGPSKNPSREQGRCSYNSAHSREKGRQPYRNCRDARLSANEDGSDEGRNGGKNCARRKSSASNDSATAPIPSILQERQFASPSELLQDTDSQQCQSECRSFLGEISESFLRTCGPQTYGRRIHTAVKLQGILEQSPVRTMTCHTRPGKQIRHFLRAEWRAFVTENHLQVGQQLLFILSADSFFVVRDQSACS